MIAIRPIRSPIYIFLVSPHRLDRRSTELDCYMLQEVGRRSLWDALSWETLWEYSSEYSWETLWEYSSDLW